jgi:LysR family transcriptional regulator, nitrogen assimilation regulatory protein
MNFRQLKYFAAIYEHGTLSQAAEHMRVAVSALSHHLANLESELGSALFVRKPRGMQPTAAGTRLYTHARSILRSVSAAEKDIKDTGGEVSGEVSLGMSYSAVKAIGIPLIQRVLLEYPKLKLSLTESLSGPTLDHLKSSEVDLALVYNPPTDPRLKIEPVLEEELYCLGRREIIGDTDAAIRFDDILKLPIILLRQGKSARALMDDLAPLKKLESKALIQLNSVYAISGAILVGLGCTIGTKLMMREQLESGTLHFRPIVSPELTRTLCMCEMVDRPPTFALETVRSVILELVAEAIRSKQWESTSILIGSKHRA